MADHVIDIDPLDPFSVLRATIQYNLIRREYDQRVDEFLFEIANRGRQILDDCGYTVDSGEVTVTVEEIDNGFRINTAGKGVVFLEFGAGDAVNAGNQFASQVPVEVRPGSYSETHDQQYSLTGRWVFGGVIYTEIVPKGGMEAAWNVMLSEWRDIAERVFA